MDVAGRVEAVGRSVQGLEPGDAVFGRSSTGTLAEYTRAPADNFAPKPTSMPWSVPGRSGPRTLSQPGPTTPVRLYLIPPRPRTSCIEPRPRPIATNYSCVLSIIDSICQRAVSSPNNSPIPCQNNSAANRRSQNHRCRDTPGTD